ncbi:Replicative DNA helicase [Magnetospirillum sp. LM-5]|uniref:replicative DNA helicase n=1 Tax=Magnetospirillum sp. LM-5 TaxID=2681466 RepID=UPI001380D951|nr:replicative DNA helicase [Magnetospirillum sp. LM-5]CAA7611624.1 Replicative DNA helicase [Magnetospirillum sp. LM-5]
MSSVIPFGSGAPTGEGVPFRTPPHNYEAEQALLGAILLNNRAFEKVSEFLRPEHFAEPAHGRIFAACGKLVERGQIANPVTLKTFFENDGGLAEIGGTPYLAQLANAVVSIINAEDYGKLVHDLHLRRELIALGEELVNRAFEPQIDDPAMDQIGRAEAQLYELATTGQTEGGFETFGTVLVEAVRQAEAAHQRQGKLSGVPTGLIDMDKKLGGLHASDLLILAGRPSMGKTSLATNIAFNAAKAYREEIDALGHKKGVDGAVVAFFSLEMSSEQLATRILAEQAEISSHKIRQGEMSNDEFERLVVAAQELSRLPLHIDDTPALSISAVRTRARRLKRQHGLGLIVVDYLQLLRGTGGSSDQNRVQEVSEITRGLKALAKELDVPVIALSQLSRAVEQREDKRPQLADLRESGSIEQDADVVMFVFREQYYLERAEPARRPEEAEDKFNERYAKWQERCEQVYNTAEVIIAKQRHGPVGTVRLSFLGEFTKFGNLITDDHFEAPEY